MPMVLRQALFYPVSFPRTELLQLVHGTVQEQLDVVAFDEETGGTVERELAIPYLPGMDEVRVESARFGLRAQEKLFEVTRYSVTKTSGNEKGIVLALQEESRILKLELGYPQFSSAVRSEGTRYNYLGGKIQSREAGATKALHLVIRPATKTGTGFAFGPPIFADPPFTLTSPLYGPILGGLSVGDLGNSRFQIIFPKTRGTAFLIQLAHGDSADELVPVDFETPVQRVFIDAAVRGLNVTLAVGGTPVTVWSHPEALLPEAGVQEVDFTPLAERQLQTELEKKGGSSTDLTLPLRLSFQSSSAGAVGLSAKTLNAQYIVMPLGDAPSTNRLEGGWHPLRLEAPAARRPEASSVRARLKPLGRELNPGSDLPPLSFPTRGLRVSSQRWVAGRYDFLPSSRATSQTELPLASVRICIATPGEAEVVLEVRADVAGSPGAPLTNPLVKKLEPGFSDWLQLELPQPLPLPPGVPLWVVVRANQGELLWFAGEAGPAKMSVDRGSAWGNLETKLSPVARPLVQLFHLVSDPQPQPEIQVRIGQGIVATNLCGDAERLSDREFLATHVLPSAILDRLASTSGSDRATTELQLFSRSMMDLIVEEMTLSYDPFG